MYIYPTKWQYKRRGGAASKILYAYYSSQKYQNINTFLKICI